MQNRNIIIGVSIATITVIGVMIAIALRPVDIIKATFNNDYKKETLYRGETKVNGSFGYNQYAAYDGKNVSIVLSRIPIGASFTLKVGDKVSEPFSDKYNSIPMELELEEGGTTVGKLIDKDGKEYDITIEFPIDVEQNTLHGDEVTQEAPSTEVPLILSPEQEEWNDDENRGQ